MHQYTRAFVSGNAHSFVFLGNFPHPVVDLDFFQQDFIKQIDVIQTLTDISFVCVLSFLRAILLLLKVWLNSSAGLWAMRLILLKTSWSQLELTRLSSVHFRHQLVKVTRYENQPSQVNLFINSFYQLYVYSKWEREMFQFTKFTFYITKFS